MKLIHIAPTNLIEFVDEEYNKGLNMVLTHLVLNDEVYRETFAAITGEKYLDNSFFELGYALPVDELLQAAELVNATTLICADGTREGMMAYKLAGYKVMCIPITIEQLDMMLADERIDYVGVSAIHFPDRFDILSTCDFPDNPKIHILGMGHPREFKELSVFKKHIVSWDTSAAIWQGHLGHHLATLEAKDKTPVRFNEEVTFNLLMKDNITYMEECAK